MLLVGQTIERQYLAFFDKRQRVSLLLILRVLLVFALFIDREETVELDYRAGRAEQVTRARADIDRRLIKEGRHHLRRNEPLPDQLVQRKLVLRQERRDRIRRAHRRRWADRFVSVLRTFLRAIKHGLLGQVLRTELSGNQVSHFSESGIGDPRRIGSHVGDQTDQSFISDLNALVQLLRDLHRPLHRKPQFARSFLLEFRGDERRNRIALLLFSCDRSHDELLLFNLGKQILCLFLFPDMNLGCLEILTKVRRLHRFVVDSQQSRVEDRRKFGRQVRDDGPVLGCSERFDLALTLYDQTHRDRLNAPGRESASHLVPQQRADLIADYSVKQPARLLGVHEVLVDIDGMLERFLNRGLGDFVEHHTSDGFSALAAALKLFLDVPADRFAFAVRVSRHIDHVGVFRGRLQLPDHLFFAGDHLVCGLEVVVEIDADALLGKVLDVADRGEHFVLGAEILIDRFRF